MKKKLLFFFLLIGQFVYSQQIEWARDISLPIKKSYFLNNDFCFMGTSNDTLKIDSMDYHWNPHPYSYMAALNKDGTIDNVLHLSAVHPNDFTRDNNACYVSGGQWTFCMAKTELNGNIPWSDCYSCPSCGHYPSLAAVSLIKHTNSLYVVGGFEDSLLLGNQWVIGDSRYNSLLTKVNPLNGNIIWVKNIPRSIQKIIDLNDDTFIMGTKVFGGHSTFDSISVEVHYSSGIAISRADTSGNFISAKLIVEGWGVYLKDMDVDSDKNIFITGTFTDTCKIGSIIYTSNNDSFFLVKTDSLGNVLWTKIFSEPFQSGYGTGPWSLCVTPDNSVCLTGTFHYDSLDLHDVILHKVGNGENAFLVKYSSSGQFLSVRTVYSSEYCYVNEVTSDDEGALYWWGWYKGEVQIENYSFQSHNMYNCSSFLVKISGESPTDFVNIPKQNPIIYPNPTSGIFTIALPQNQTVTKVIVRNVLGNCMLERSCRGQSNQEINLSCQQRGIYFVELQLDDERKIIRKVVIQ